METKDVLSLMVQFETYTLVLVGTIVAILSFKNHKNRPPGLGEGLFKY